MEVREAALSLLCRVQTRLCALPLKHVLETMRPLPIRPISGAPQFVLGLSVIRGAPAPIVDAARLLGAEEARPTRIVTVKVGARTIGLAVDGVLGVRSIPEEARQELPPLLESASTDVVSAIGILDAELLLVLNAARFMPEDLWAAFESGEGAA